MCGLAPTLLSTLCYRNSEVFPMSSDVLEGYHVNVQNEM
jgi:hypothetical protein